jgi:hypothetical protein
VGGKGGGGVRGEKWPKHCMHIWIKKKTMRKRKKKPHTHKKKEIKKSK